MKPTIPPIPPNRPPLAPYLIVKNAAAAINFYQQVFGARELFRLSEPSGKIGHAELELAGSHLLLADEYPDFGALSPISVGGSPVMLHLYIEDVDRTIARAVELGATILRPARDEFFGDRTGMIADPFGHKWQLASQKEVVTPEEMQRRMDSGLGE